MKKKITITTITALLVLLALVVMIDGFGQGPKQPIDQTSETSVSETINEPGALAPTKNPSQLKTGEERFYFIEQPLAGGTSSSSTLFSLGKDTKQIIAEAQNPQIEYLYANENNGLHGLEVGGHRFDLGIRSNDHILGSEFSMSEIPFDLKKDWSLISVLNSYDSSIRLFLTANKNTMREFSLVIENKGAIITLVDTDDPLLWMSREVETLFPIKWLDEQSVLLEAWSGGGGDQHAGLWSLNILTGELLQIIDGSYAMSTPVFLDGPTIAYFAGIEIGTQKDPIHGHSTHLYKLNLIDGSVGLLYKAKDGFWINALGSSSEIKTTTHLEKPAENAGFSNTHKSGSSMYLPWQQGINRCATRDGSNGSPLPIGSTTTCLDLFGHSYPNAYDFDTDNNSDEEILAVDAGVVIVSDFAPGPGGAHPTGYGNMVVIEHPNGLRSRYAHLAEVFVTTGQNVQSGCAIGYEGTTGTSSGDHLHFELEENQGGLYVNIPPVFLECNCTPHSGYVYTSNNSLGLCDVLCIDPYEPNNTVGNAAVIDLVGSGGPWSTSIDACVSGTSDNDWYEILLVEPGLLTVTLSEPVPLQLDLASQPSVTVTTLSNGNKRLTFCHGGLMCYPLRIRVWDPGILGSTNSDYTLSFSWNPLLSCIPNNQTTALGTPKLGSTGLTLSNVTASCSGYMITAQVSGGSGIYDWYIDGVWKGTGAVLNASAGSSGFHSILVVDRNNPCVTAWDDAIISSGTANISISPSAPSITSGGSVQLFATGGSSYSWSPSTGLSNSHVWNPIASPNTTTTYTVSVTDASGCASTQSVTVTVTSASVSVPANNTPCSAQTLSVGVSSCSYTTGTNVGATNSGVAVNPLCGSTSTSGNTTGNYSGGDVWYKVLVPSSGMVIIQTQQQSSVNDLVVAAYTGSCSNLTMIACADDQSSTNFMPLMTLTNLSPSTWVYIRVWEFGNNVFGAFGICATTAGSGSGTASGPDLVVTSFSVNDHTVDQGDNVTVSFTIRNNGNQTSPACWYTCGLANSFTATLVTGGLMNFAAIPSLAPGITYTLSLNFTIPNVNDGVYYLVLGADEPLDNVGETNENNNLAGEVVTVGNVVPQGVDLDVTTRYLSQTSGLQPGLPWEIGLTVENIGNEDAPGTNALIVLSDNTTYEPGVDIFLWQFNTSDLDPGDEDYDEKWITFPPVPHAGTWRVLFIADVNHQVQELDESNNIATRTISVVTTTPATADYVTAINYLHDKTTGQNLVNNQIQSGHELEVFTGTTNQGLIRPNIASRTNFVVSPLPYLIGMQARIGTNTHSSTGIAVGATDNASPDEFLTGVQVGINYIIARTDYRQEIYEGPAGENNNLLVYPFEVIHTGPVADLVPRIISMTPYNNALGDSIVVVTRVYNYGDTTAWNVLLRHWVSLDDQFDGRDIDGRLEQTLIGVDSLAPGDSIDVVRHMTIDNDVDAPDLISNIGQYYLLAVVDEDCEDVIESSVLNNVSSIPIYVNDISCYVNMKWHYDNTIDTVEWDATHLDWIYFESPEDCEYTITSSPWVLHPNNLTFSGQTVEYPYLPQNLTGIDRFGCVYANDRDSICFVQKAEPSVSLPVTWISIDAYEFEGNGLVYWRVGVEYDVMHYRVERSFDGMNFHEIGIVEPFNQPNSVYRFSDELHDHTVYYRVIAVDHDGTEDQSDIVSLIGYRPYEKGTYTLIHYNDGYQLESFSPIRYQVYSMLGQVMRSSECNPGEICDIQMEQAGMYMLVITLYDEYYVEKLIFK